MFNRKKDKDLNDKTHTTTKPCQVYEAGPYLFQGDALKEIPSGYIMIQLEFRDDGWYATAVSGYSTSTVTTTYYPWPELKPVNQ